MQNPPTSQRPWLPALPIERTLAFSVVAMAILLAMSKPLTVNDLGVYLRMGTWMLEHRRLLEIEPFALAAEGTSFQNGTWLSQVLFSALFRVGGYPAMQGLLGLVTLLTLGVVVGHLVRASGWRLAGLGGGMAFLFLLQNLAVRPQTLVLPLFVALHKLLACGSSRRWTPLLAALLMALWANLHGSFPVAFLLPMAYWLEALVRERRSDPRWIGVGLAMLVGTLCSPYGPGLYVYIMENSRLPAQRGLDEWLPPRPDTFLGGRFYLAVVVVLGVAWFRRARVRVSDLVLLGVTGVAATQSLRMIVWWGLLTPPILVRWISRGEAGEARRSAETAVASSEASARLHTRLGYTLLLLWGVLMAASLPGLRGPSVDARGDYPGLDRETPVEAGTWLAAHPAGRMFCRFEWSSYFLWRSWPESRPWIDIRMWIFPAPIWQTYLEISRAAPGWQVSLERERIETLVLSPQTQAPLLEALATSSGWVRVHADVLAEVWVRTPVSNASPPGEVPAALPGPLREGGLEPTFD